MDPELREYLDKLSEGLSKSHEDTRSDLKALKTLLQGQTRKLDELSGNSCVKDVEITHDNVADDLTQSEETADIVPDLAASAASVMPLEFDATGMAAPTPTNCSTDGCNHNASGDDHMAACQAAWSTPPCFTVLPGAAPTPSSEPNLGLTLGALAHTKYSTEVSEVSFDSIVLVSMSGAARRATVTTLYTDASQAVVPTLAPTTPHTNYNGPGQEIRPRPWPSFKYYQEAVQLSMSGLRRQYLQLAVGIWAKMKSSYAECTHWLDADSLSELTLVLNPDALAPTKCLTVNLRHGDDTSNNIKATIVSLLPSRAVPVFADTKFVSVVFMLWPPRGKMSDWQPWPPPWWVWITHKGHRFRPVPWPSFDCSHQGMHLKHLRLLRPSIHVTEHFRDFLNFLRDSWRYLPSVQLKQCLPEKVVYWIPMVPKDTSVPSQQIMRLVDARLKLPWLSISRKHVLSEILHVVHAQVRDLASCFYLEKLWDSRDNLYENQDQSNFYEHHVLEHAVVCSIPMPDKLQGTMLIMNMSVQWEFWSPEEFQGSGCFAKQCSSEQYSHLLSQLNCCFEQIPIGKPFSCLKSTQWQSWCPPDRGTSDVQCLSQECYRHTVVQETSCLGTFPAHAGHLIYTDFINIPVMGSEAMHRKQVNHRGLQSYPCYILRRREGAEYSVHCNAYDFDSENFALVRKLENSALNNSVLSVVGSLLHGINTCFLGDVLVLTWRSQGLSVEQLQEATPSFDIIVLTWLDSRKMAVQYNSVKGKEIKRKSHLCLGIQLPGSLSILIELKECSYAIKSNLPPCASTSRALMMLLFEWPCPTSGELVARVISLSVAVASMEKLCSRSLYFASTRCSGFLCDILHSYRHQVTMNSIDKGSNILLAQLPVLKFLSHDRYEPDGITDKFQHLAELGLGMSWDPGGRYDRAPVAFLDKTHVGRGGCCFDHAYYGFN